MDNCKVIIRSIKYDDIEQVASIRVNAWQEVYKGIIDETFLLNMNIEKRKQDYNQGHFIVSEMYNGVVGFCRFGDRLSENSEEYDGEILALYVKPECKYNGIGIKMFTYAMNKLKEENKEKIVIWCLKENYPSRKFYEKMGGELIGEKDISIGEKIYEEVGYGYIIDK